MRDSNYMDQIDIWSGIENKTNDGDDIGFE